MACNRFPQLVALTAALFCTACVLAGPQEYFCTVAQDIAVQDDGNTTPPKFGSLVGRTLAVSRGTGQVIVPYSAFFMSERMQFKVLARGNTQNSFVTIGTEPAGGEGVFTMLLTVQEFAKSQRKPFLLSSGVRALTGTCE